MDVPLRLDPRLITYFPCGRQPGAPIAWWGAGERIRGTEGSSDLKRAFSTAGVICFVADHRDAAATYDSSVVKSNTDLR